jgi:hypothetical protein
MTPVILRSIAAAYYRTSLKGRFGMKKGILLMCGMALLSVSPAFAGEADKHGEAMCDKHCNIMDLQKKVDALKAGQQAQDKLATKEHLKKDIEAYEKKLEALKAELEAK